MTELELNYQLFKFFHFKFSKNLHYKFCRLGPGPKPCTLRKSETLGNLVKASSSIRNVERPSFPPTVPSKSSAHNTSNSCRPQPPPGPSSKPFGPSPPRFPNRDPRILSAQHPSKLTTHQPSQLPAASSFLPLTPNPSSSPRGPVFNRQSGLSHSSCQTDPAPAYNPNLQFAQSNFQPGPSGHHPDTLNPHHGPFTSYPGPSSSNPQPGPSLFNLQCGPSFNPQPGPSYCNTQGGSCTGAQLFRSAYIYMLFLYSCSLYSDYIMKPFPYIYYFSITENLYSMNKLICLMFLMFKCIVIFSQHSHHPSQSAAVPYPLLPLVPDPSSFPCTRPLIPHSGMVNSSCQTDPHPRYSANLHLADSNPQPAGPSSLHHAGLSSFFKPCHPPPQHAVQPVPFVSHPGTSGGTHEGHQCSLSTRYV